MTGSPLIDDQLVLRIERLRDEVESLKKDLRTVAKDRAVQSTSLRERAASAAERWLVEVAGVPNVVSAIGEELVAERSVYFQRLLTFAERYTLRRKYDQSINAILKDFRRLVIVPLKSRRNSQTSNVSDLTIAASTLGVKRNSDTVFIGQSFSSSDKEINDIIQRFFVALGLTVLTGEKPKSGSVSKKVKERIDKAGLFVGIFTKRDKLEGKQKWTTSSWVIDEKAYAVAKNKKLFIIRESGVDSIGGLQGDYEYLEFDRDAMADLLVRLLEMYRS